MKIAIIIVNYRTPEMVADCLNSLKSEFREGHTIKVFVGDSASGDHSEEYLTDFIDKNCKEWCRFIPFDKNGGFAYGNNYLIEHGVRQDEEHFDYIHFLNPDTRINSGAVLKLAEFLEDNPKAGVVGSMLTDEEGTPEIFGFRFPSPLRQFFIGARFGLFDKIFKKAPVSIIGLDKPTRVDWVTGASFMIPSRILSQVGLMDDEYFLYYEEIDYMRRIMLAGNEIWFNPESIVIHMAGQSTGVNAKETLLNRLPVYWYESRFKFLKDNYGYAQAFLGILLFIMGVIFNKTKCLLLNRPSNDPAHIIKDSICYPFLRKG